MASTAHTDRFRRQLLRQAVDENLETISGQPLGTRRRRRALRRARLKRIAVALGGVLSATALGIAGWLVVELLPGPGASVGASAARLALAAGPPSADRHVVERLAERLAVRPPQPLVPDVIPLRVGRIALDPGHGGVDGGTSLTFGLLEKDLTKDIANRLRELLAADGFEVVLTREGDETVSLAERAARANAAHADLFLSIHVNWLPDRSARGVETYYAGPTEDPFLSHLAAAENHGSGLSLADFRRLVDGLYADLRQASSQSLASDLQRSLFVSLKERNPSIVSRGIRSAPFAVLIATEMPAALAEVACLSNEGEARLLAQPSYRQRIAGALLAGISSYARRMSRQDSEPEKGTS